MLRQRVLSAAILVPIVVAIFLLGRPFIDAFVAAVAALAAWETFALLRRARYRAFPLYGTVLAAALVVAGAAVPSLPGTGVWAALPAVPAIGLLVAGAAALWVHDPRDGFAAWIGTAFGALYVGLLAFAPVLMAAAPPLPGGAALGILGAGRGWLLVLIGAVWSYDSFAYVFGRAFGRRRFLQHVSPSKTYAGLFGGLAGAVVVAALVLAGLGRSPLEGIPVGLLVGLSAQAGDLAESMLKRAADAKDSGQLIPGHGGMLDRVDSFLFAAPVLAAYVALVPR
ncbi:MAG: phosphatidate cytidylyltransferase [Chloroflexi bacterium]|nr:phosphatidate cytidylyltransferase [Chloroflexota bacterium]